MQDRYISRNTKFNPTPETMLESRWLWHLCLDLQDHCFLRPRIWWVYFVNHRKSEVAMVFHASRHHMNFSWLHLFLIYFKFTQFLDFGRLVMIDIHNYNILHNSFTVLKISWVPSICSSSPPHSPPLTTTLCFFYIFFFPGMSYSWNHVACCLLKLSFFT